jgi:hypothetical protein
VLLLPPLPPPQQTASATTAAAAAACASAVAAAAASAAAAAVHRPLPSAIRLGPAHKRPAKRISGVPPATRQLGTRVCVTASVSYLAAALQPVVVAPGSQRIGRRSEAPLNTAPGCQAASATYQQQQPGCTWPLTSTRAQPQLAPPPSGGAPRTCPTTRIIGRSRPPIECSWSARWTPREGEPLQWNSGRSADITASGPWSDARQCSTATAQRRHRAGHSARHRVQHSARHRAEHRQHTPLAPHPAARAAESVPSHVGGVLAAATKTAERA